VTGLFDGIMVKMREGMLGLMMGRFLDVLLGKACQSFIFIIFRLQRLASYLFEI
jgi:hypothetical protein